MDLENCTDILSLESGLTDTLSFLLYL